MKKILAFLLGLFLTFNIHAQVVTGFNNITDVDGNLHSLSTYLNDGKFVILNFYLKTCGNCMATAPKIQSIYNDFGENQCELIVLNIIIDDDVPPYTDQECITWMANNGCPGPPNFSDQTGIEWYQFYSVHGGSFAQSYLISPANNSVIFSHAGGVLDEAALRVVLNSFINIGASNTGSSSVTACDSYTWEGQTYSTGGSYDQTFSNTSGCDSLHTLVLTINSSNSGSGSYSSPTPIVWEGQTISSSGSYTATLTNVLGCDSIATLEFTLGSPSAINDINYNIKSIVKVIDFLGRESAGKKNETLFYIYNDGTVEQRIVVE
ncbi:MAG: redoxin domain-containing protein [Bacteroidota bacterium]|nr:redoxin domain-containing protein [Bacteroidota bacterium]MEC9209861.1 redoxin domain-containing protein [Bacteroidota bacterium]